MTTLIADSLLFINLKYHHTEPVVQNPCNPSPCGPNSQCQTVNGLAVCTCVVGYLGSPPSCRPECAVSTDCPRSQACTNQKCIDPCVGICGLQAQCQVINHSPICSCPASFTGDPFIRCLPERKKNFSPKQLIISDEIFVNNVNVPAKTPPLSVNPCQPSPCGPNAMCRVVNDSPSCSCLPEFIGTPPNCRAECVVNSECSSQLSCINNKCRDPCVGSCGVNSDCRVVSHTPNCVCPEGTTGDPYTQCVERQCKSINEY